MATFFISLIWFKREKKLNYILLYILQLLKQNQEKTTENVKTIYQSFR